MIEHPDGKTSFDYPGWIKAKKQRAAILVPPWVEAIRRDFGR